MTRLLESAPHRIEALSPSEQDAIAAQIIETLDDNLADYQKIGEQIERSRAAVARIVKSRAAQNQIPKALPSTTISILIVPDGGTNLPRCMLLEPSHG